MILRSALNAKVWTNFECCDRGLVNSTRHALRRPRRNSLPIQERKTDLQNEPSERGLSVPVVTPLKIPVWFVTDITEFSAIDNALDLT